LETPSGTIEFHSLANTVVSDIVDAAYMVAEGRSEDVWAETQIGFSLATLLSAYRNGLPDGQMEENHNDDSKTPPISTSETRLVSADEIDNPLDDDESAGYRFVMTLDPSQYCQARAGQDQGGDSLFSWPIGGTHGDQSGAGEGAGTAVGSARALAGLHFGWVLADQPDDEVKTSSDDQRVTRKCTPSAVSGSSSTAYSVRRSKSAIIPDMSLELCITCVLSNLQNLGIEVTKWLCPEVRVFKLVPSALLPSPYRKIGPTQ
jgi:hypothetical protein